MFTDNYSTVLEVGRHRQANMQCMLFVCVVAVVIVVVVTLGWQVPHSTLRPGEDGRKRSGLWREGPGGGQPELCLP